MEQQNDMPVSSAGALARLCLDAKGLTMKKFEVVQRVISDDDVTFCKAHIAQQYPYSLQKALSDYLIVRKLADNVFLMIDESSAAPQATSQNIFRVLKLLPFHRMQEREPLSEVKDSAGPVDDYEVKKKIEAKLQKN